MRDKIVVVGADSGISGIGTAVMMTALAAHGYEVFSCDALNVSGGPEIMELRPVLSPAEFKLPNYWDSDGGPGPTGHPRRHRRNWKLKRQSRRENRRRK